MKRKKKKKKKAKPSLYGLSRQGLASSVCVMEWRGGGKSLDGPSVVDNGFSHTQRHQCRLFATAAPFIVARAQPSQQFVVSVIFPKKKSKQKFHFCFSFLIYWRERKWRGMTTFKKKTGRKIPSDMESQSNRIVFDIFFLADTILVIMRLVFSFSLLLLWNEKTKNKNKKRNILFFFDLVNQ